MRYRPHHIKVEATTLCQLECPSCPTAKGMIGERFGKGRLKIEDFRKIIDNNRWVSTIELSNWGEVFLNPDLAKMLGYAYDNAQKYDLALNSFKKAAALNPTKKEIKDKINSCRLKIRTSHTGEETGSAYKE